LSANSAATAANTIGRRASAAMMNVVDIANLLSQVDDPGRAVHVECVGGHKVESRELSET
jgi:hypothetical protein